MHSSWFLHFLHIFLSPTQHILNSANLNLILGWDLTTGVHEGTSCWEDLWKTGPFHPSVLGALAQDQLAQWSAWVGTRIFADKTTDRTRWDAERRHRKRAYTAVCSGPPPPPLHLLHWWPTEPSNGTTLGTSPSAHGPGLHEVVSLLVAVCSFIAFVSLLRESGIFF